MIRKESGKSFVATSIGKILFGDKFRSRHMPDNLNDLRTILGENYYLVFDNLDHFVNREMANALCVTATGGTVEKRKLYTDHDIVKVRPHIYLVITTREPKFKYDDLVSRLLLFNTKKIDRPISSSHLFKTLMENRDSIISEVLVNLSSIVKMLKIQSTFVPRCTERIADWETFVRKVAGGITWPYMFGAIMEKMNAEKDRFGLEDDYLYILLKHIVYENNEPIEDDSASELYSMLCETAVKMKIKNFRDRYKSPVSVGKRIGNVKDELARVFDFDIRAGDHNQKLYSFRPKRDEEGEVESPEEQVREVQLDLFEEKELKELEIMGIKERTLGKGGSKELPHTSKEAEEAKPAAEEKKSEPLGSNDKKSMRARIKKLEKKALRGKSKSASSDKAMS